MLYLTVLFFHFTKNLSEKVKQLKVKKSRSKCCLKILVKGDREHNSTIKRSTSSHFHCQAFLWARFKWSM